ncbi:hypothetical protein PN462_12120, partial [Spirulina sp. CS-785/01]|uniref:hypothetical protein n=1 Tax=Spirulina sp. CS-785/01 TaxID=3021716 RepID=UPI00232EC19A
SMRSLRGCESQPHRSRSVSAGEAVSTHPLSSPTCSEVGESRGSFVERFDASLADAFFVAEESSLTVLSHLFQG